MTRARWDKIMNWPLTMAGLVFLAAYAIPIIWPDSGPPVAHTCRVTLAVIWTLFVLDYAVRFALAEEKWSFAKSSWFDLAVMALPLLRPLHVIRLFALLGIVQRSGGSRLRRTMVSYTAGASILLLVLGALAITRAERGHPESTITTVAEGLWWALTTMTSVGYGDLVPVTSDGRLVASAVMLGGVALAGIVSATIASWLVSKVTYPPESDEELNRKRIESLTQEISALRRIIEQQERGSQGR